jgi:predicted nuclease of predicted toxin-antitoxin system
VRFYLDEDLAPSIAVGLRKKGIDAVSAHEVGNVGLGDTEQLAFAAGQRRCLVSKNARDFGRLGHAAVDQGHPHAGIVLCPPRMGGGNVGVTVSALMAIAARYPAGLGEYDVIYL